MEKPREILELEKAYNITFVETFQDQKSLKLRYRNHYELNKDGKVIKLSLVNHHIKEIIALDSLESLIHLNLIRNQISEIKNLNSLKNLKYLNLSTNYITEIKNLDNLDNLISLNLSGNQITNIKGLGILEKIQELNLSRNKISEIENLTLLKNLTKLFLSENKISKIQNLNNLEKLEKLILYNNQIQNIENIETLKKLSLLDISDNQLTEINNLEKLENLKIIDLSQNDISNIENLSHLKNLVQLDLSNNNLKEIENIDNLEKLEILRLSGNEIYEIKNLSSSRNLRDFDISNNQLSEIKNLEHLSNLSELDLGGNNIKEIKNLNFNTNLVTVQLNENRITEIKNLNDLINLKILSLHGNEIEEIQNLNSLNSLVEFNISANKLSEIKNLNGLPNLSELEISYNQIEEIENLNDLINLNNLDLSGNNISEIKNLDRLKNLNDLDLSENNISEIKNLESLKNLVKLDLSDNLIEEIKNLESLSKLINLQISSNQIKEIKEIEFLQEIVILNLSNNEIGEINDISKLEKLRSFDLSNNKLRNIHPLLPLITKGLNINVRTSFRGINITNNPLGKPPMNVVEQGRVKIIEWFEESRKYGTEPLYEAKLLIVGEPRHGKSSLRKKLLDPTYKIPDDYLEETLGVEIHPDYVVENSNIEQNIKVNIWDFGGQEKQYYLHQYFLKKNAVYILVSDNRKDNPNFDYWMSKLKLIAGTENEVLILFNQINRTSESTNFNSKQYEGLGLLFKEFHLDLSKDINRFNELKEYIDLSLLNLSHIGEEYPKYCKAISDKIDEKKEKENLDYITIQVFEELCRDLGYSEPDVVHKSLDYLDLIGKIIYYENDELLNHLIILNPHWLIDAIYGIITSKELEDQKGKFTKQWLKNYLGNAQPCREKTYSKSEIDNILKLMLKNHYDICYTLNNNDFLVPLLMPNELPVNNIDFSDGLQIIFKYEIIPKGLISRILVRKSNYIFNNLICSNAGILFNDNTYVLITEHFEKNDANRYIKIIAKGENEVQFLQELRSELISVQHSWFSSLEVVELIPCNCNECKKSLSPELYDKNFDLVRRTKKGKIKIECRKSDEQVEILSLLGAVYDKKIIDFYTREEIENMRKKFPDIYFIKNYHKSNKYKFAENSIFENNQIGGEQNEQQN
ncbi:leucine-rich repeat domain-containing protein [Chryseobacterium wangxinyae]|uniref:leucine-rich repeat domain-containing protein n=1 Tax=Chryseobacterium sp. CY353 TaxID=2997334 RepID=UPI002270484C|nr:leucine-rich repeat domain-containing protein [Chryseobacterium sp. CY353]MCY0968286.1 hypothetical protein [Chryseobacterium sp. CY353]